jgi:hypothetical protein
VGTGSCERAGGLRSLTWSSGSYGMWSSIASANRWGSKLWPLQSPGFSGEDRDKVARSPRVVVAGPGSRASSVREQAQGLGAAWLGSFASGSAARPVGGLGRWTGTTAVAATPGSLKTEQSCGSTTVLRESHQLMILDPIDPCGAARWDQGIVTKEALRSADPGLWEPRVGNDPRPPGPKRAALLDLASTTTRAKARLSRKAPQNEGPRLSRRLFSCASFP